MSRLLMLQDIHHQTMMTIVIARWYWAGYHSFKIENLLQLVHGTYTYT